MANTGPVLQNGSSGDEVKRPGTVKRGGTAGQTRWPKMCLPLKLNNN
jgi:hypothetical protein